MNPVSSSEATAPSSPCSLPATDAADWFKTEVHVHDGQLKSYLRGAFPGVRDVDDVVQESYLKIWKSVTRAPIGSAKTYLFTVARHLALNFLRRERGAPVEFRGSLGSLSVLDDRPHVAEVLSNQEKADLLAEALAVLPPKSRELLFRHKFEGQSHAEVAREFGITTKAAERRIAKAIDACTAYLRKRGREYL